MLQVCGILMVREAVYGRGLEIGGDPLYFVLSFAVNINASKNSQLV